MHRKDPKPDNLLNTSCARIQASAGIGMDGMINGDDGVDGETEELNLDIFFNRDVKEGNRNVNVADILGLEANLISIGPAEVVDLDKFESILT